MLGRLAVFRQSGALAYDAAMDNTDQTAEGLQPEEHLPATAQPSRQGMCGTFLIREALSKMPEAERLYWVEHFGEVEELCRPDGRPSDLPG